jgi:nucleoside-diphosphate-sugar epimerase
MHVMRELFFKERFAHNQLTILRPCAIYGNGDTHNSYGINQFIRTAKASHEITLFGNGEEYRSNIHGDDVAAIIARAAIGRTPGTFNLNCGISYTFMQIAEIIQACMGRPVHILSQPRTMPILHRRVDNLALIKHFFLPRPAEKGIQELLTDTP